VNIVYPKPIEDWRSAVEYIIDAKMAQKGPILVWSSLVEARDMNWLSEHEKRGYLLSPFSYYTLKSNFILLPGRPDGFELEEVFSKNNAAFLKKGDELCLIAKKIFIASGDPKNKVRLSQEMLEARLEFHGFFLVRKKDFGTIAVSQFVYRYDF